MGNSSQTKSKDGGGVGDFLGEGKDFENSGYKLLIFYFIIECHA